MNTSKLDQVISAILIILLLIQVILSYNIIQRLGRLDQTMTMVLIRMRPSEQVAPDYIENISTDDDPTLGTKGSPVTIVEFSDYECPFCADAAKKVKTLLADYKGKVLFVYRDFPLEQIHPHAFKAAEAAHCAGDQGKFWEMNEFLFAHQEQLDSDSLNKHAPKLGLDTTLFSNCLNSGKYFDEVRHDIEDATKYQVNSTPTFFVNGYRVMGIEQLQQAIDLALQSAK